MFSQYLSKAAIAPLACIVAITLVSACKNKGQARESPHTTPSHSESDHMIEIQDSRGEHHTFRNSPIKIVSLLPSITEYLFQLDKGHLLVGRSDSCRFPPETSDIPVTDSRGRIDRPKVLGLAPDVVFAGPQLPNDDIEYLTNQGLNVVTLDLKTLEDIRNSLRNLGKILSNSGDVETLLGWMDRHYRDISREIDNGHEDIDRPETLILDDLNPLHTVENKTFVDELISAASGINLITSETSLQPPLSPKQLRDLQPQVLIIATREGELASMTNAAQQLGQSELWSDIDAIKNNRVYLIDYDLLTIPGPRQVQALRQIAHVLHPDMVDFPPKLIKIDLSH